MSENSETQKICHDCNQANKSDDNFCRNCGSNLEGIEPIKTEAVQLPPNSEINKVEFNVSYKTKKKCYKIWSIEFFNFCYIHSYITDNYIP